MNAKKCDKCGAYYDYGDTIAGGISRSSIGALTKHYPDAYDLCPSCAKTLQKVIYDWWKTPEERKK